jgi:phage head maturation protease
MKTKIFDAAITCDDAKREIVGIISTEAVDRDKEVLLMDGMIANNFQGNPVVYLNHKHDNFPVGKCLWIKASTSPAGKPCLIAKTYITDKTQEGQDCFKLFQDGILNCFSVGFLPKTVSKPTREEITQHPEWEKAERVIRSWELLEYSVAGIPANPECMSLCVSKGFDSEKIKKYTLDQPEVFPKVEKYTIKQYMDLIANRLLENK